MTQITVCQVLICQNDDSRFLGFFSKTKTQFTPPTLCDQTVSSRRMQYDELVTVADGSFELIGNLETEHA